MKIIILMICLFLSINQAFSQSLYVREWGTMIEPIKFGSNFIADVNPVNGNLYYVKGYDEIIEYTTNNYQLKSVYKFPPAPGGTIFENLKFDSKGNIIITGRTLGSAPVTFGSYSQNYLRCGLNNNCSHTGASFILKINTSGNIIWCTYFYCLSQNNTHITLDKNDNIYFVGKRHKNIVLSGNSFQTVADTISIINYQDVISKLNNNGQLVWNTYYTKDQSLIKSIAAADDGIYVYGDHMASTSTSNYFGTLGSYQEYATGVFTGSGGNEKNVFLSKFTFNGTREWSTYFAVDRSMVPYSEILRYFGGLTVVNNEPYILTKHEIRPIMVKNPTTRGAFLTDQVSMSQFDLTATKFSSTGKKVWSTFLYYGEAINNSFHTNELIISGTAIENNKHISSLTTKNSHQPSFGGGRTDNHTFILSGDGSKMNYGSLYGASGSDFGVTFATRNGFYTLGYSFLNNTVNSIFSTNPSLNQFTYNNGKGYWGTYASYFKNKSLGTNKDDNSNITFSIYPNPTTDILNIQTEENLPENTTAIVYDVTGKRVLNEPLQNSNLNQINVSHLNSAIYILQIDGSNLNHSFKFIKN